MSLLRRFFDALPIIAILRGLRPEDAPWAMDALVAAGIRIVEVPLNSPRPLESLRQLVGRGRRDLLIGAGRFSQPTTSPPSPKPGRGLLWRRTAIRW